MKLCWNATYGPMPINAYPGVAVNAAGSMPLDADYTDVWRIVHVPSREVLDDLVIYADDEVGEIWRFEVDQNGLIKTQAGPFGDGLVPVIEKLVLGPGKIRLERRA